MAITRRPELDLVVDVQMPPQINEPVYTEFKDDGLGLFFEKKVDEGLMPEEFGRIWCHTHPGISATPSGKDETTFANEFAGPDWAIMFILAKKGEMTCRLRWRPNPAVAHVVPIETCKMEVPVVFPDWSAPFRASDIEAWKAEYTANFHRRTYQSNPTNTTHTQNAAGVWVPSTTGNQGTGFGHRTNNWRPTPGWRCTSSLGDGSFGYRQAWYAHDIANGIRNTEDWYKAYGDTLPASWKIERVSSSPIGLYRGNEKRQLTKREKKYLKQHGNLDGYVPPKNPGYKEPQQMVKTEKLETSRNLLDQWETDPDLLTEDEWKKRWEGIDDDDYNELYAAYQLENFIKDMEDSRATYWTVVTEDYVRIYNIKATSATAAMDMVDWAAEYMDSRFANVPRLEDGDLASYALPQSGEYVREKYTVTLRSGTKFERVMAYDKADAINRVQLDQGLEPYIDDEEKAIIRGFSEEIEEPSDEDLKQIQREEQEELQLVPLDDATEVEAGTALVPVSTSNLV